MNQPIFIELTNARDARTKKFTIRADTINRMYRKEYCYNDGLQNCIVEHTVIKHGTGKEDLTAIVEETILDIMNLIKQKADESN